MTRKRIKSICIMAAFVVTAIWLKQTKVPNNQKKAQPKDAVLIGEGKRTFLVKLR